MKVQGRRPDPKLGAARRCTDASACSFGAGMIRLNVAPPNRYARPYEHRLLLRRLLQACIEESTTRPRPHAVAFMGRLLYPG